MKGNYSRTEPLPEPEVPSQSAGEELESELLPGTSFAQFVLERELKGSRAEEHGARSVWLARDTKLERQVVLKLARVGRSGAGQDLNREYEWLVSLAHDHLPKLFAAGVDARGQWSWLAMEYVDGATLDRAIADLGVEVTASLLWQACRALDFLHEGHHVVHGDLKPFNILVESAGGRAHLRLIDLGLSGRLGEGRTGVVRGTPYYAAASILRGECPTVASDLYALGVSFIVAVAGSREGEAQLAELVPPELARVLRRLVLQDEDTRYSSAREVLRDLRELVPAELRREEGAFVRPRFVGRRAELLWTERWLSELREGTSPTSVLLVRGFPGVGKTRFLEEVGRRASRDEMRVLRLSPHSQLGGRYSALIGVLDALSVHEDRSAMLAQLIELKERLRQAEQSRDLEETPEFRDAALWLDLLRALQSAADQCSILILIDELEASSPVLLDFLRFVSRNTKAAMVGFLVAQSEASADSRRLDERGCRQIELERLSHSEAIELIESILGTTVCGEEHTELIASATDGHPQFCTAASAAVLAEAVKAEPDIARVLREELPRTLASALELQLKALQPRERTIVDRLCVLSPLSPAAVQRELLADLEQVERSLIALVEAGVLERRVWSSPEFVPERQAYSFRSEALRHLARELASEAEREACHAAARRAWLAVEPSGDRDVALTRHGIGAGSAEHALEFAQTALEHLVAVRSFREAVSLGRDALALVVDRLGEQAASVMREPIGDGYYCMGELQAARDSYGAALDFASDRAGRARLLRKRAFVLDHLGETDRAYDDLQKAYDQNATEDPDGRIAICKHLGVVEYRRGNSTAAEVWLWRAFDGIREPELDERAAPVWNNLAGVANYRNRPEEASRYIQRSLRIRERNNDLGGLSRSLSTLGQQAMISGQLKSARESFTRSLAIKRRLGNRSSVALTLSNLAQLDHWVGSYGPAIHNYEEALAIRIEVKDLAGEVTTRAHLSEVWRLKGELLEALEQAQRAALNSAGRQDVARVNALFALGSIERVLGRAEVATRTAREGLELARSCEAAADEALLLALLGELALDVEPDSALAEQHFDAAESLARSIQNPSVLASVLLTRAESALSLGEFERARAAALEAEVLAEDLKLRFMTARTELILGRVASAEGDLVEASRRLHRAEEYALLFASPELTWQVYLALGIFHRAGGRDQRAFQWFRKCLGVFEGIVESLRSEELTSSYLGSPNRARVLTAIETWLQE